MNAKDSCVLCGLAIGAQVWRLRTPDAEFRFCCEGCKGIYQMLNDIEETPGKAPAEGTHPQGDRP